MDVVVSLLFYIVPLILLIIICIGCALIREHRRARVAAENQRTIPAQNAVIIPIPPSSSGDNDLPPPPPYSAEPRWNFDESLPSYDKATGRS